jgi:hypothetical protein
MKRSKHVDSGRKGKAVEHLIAALCVLGSDGELNAWTSLVDDEGVDLVIQRRNRPETLSLQIKARFTTAKGIAEKQRFHSLVRKATLRPRKDLYMIFVVVNPATLDLGPIWVIPSRRLVRGAPLSPTEKYKFVASAKSESKDKWAKYIVPKEEVPAHLLGVLRECSRQSVGANGGRGI